MHDDDVRQSWQGRLRSIPITGVMPLPAVNEQRLGRTGTRQHEVARRLVQLHDEPGTGAAHQVVADGAVRDGLDGDRDAAVRPIQRRRQGVRPPLPNAVDIHPDPRVLTGRRAAASPGRDGSPASPRPRSRGAPAGPAHASHRGTQRGEQVEEVGGHQRCGQPRRGAEQPAAAEAQGGGGGGNGSALLLSGAAKEACGPTSSLPAKICSNPSPTMRLCALIWLPHDKWMPRALCGPRYHSPTGLPGHDQKAPRVYPWASSPVD